MAITAGNDILASDFIAASAGAGSSGKVPKLNSSGVLDHTFVTGGFGGTGADGALTITTGTTTISCSSLGYLEKNYTSISITGTGNLAFSSPNNTSGTFVALRSQGGVTLTTSSTHAIDMRSMGGGLGTGQWQLCATTIGGAGGSSTAGVGGNRSFSSSSNIAAMALTGPLLPALNPLIRYAPPAGNGQAGQSGWNAGSGGGSGGSGGSAGLGGGGLYIECAGAYNFTTGAIDLSGGAGGNGGNGTSFWSGGSGGGAGAGGNCLVLYGTLTADSGTYNVTGSSTGGSAGTGAFGTPDTGSPTSGNGTTFRGVNNYYA